MGSPSVCCPSQQPPFSSVFWEKELERVKAAGTTDATDHHITNTETFLMLINIRCIGYWVYWFVGNNK